MSKQVHFVDLFQSKDKFLEEVIILPYADTRAGSTGTFSLPAGYKWSDFERVEWEMGVAGNTSLSFASGCVTKEVLRDKPTTWSSRISYAFDPQPVNIYVLAVGSTGAETEGFWSGYLGGSASNVFPKIIKGYTKRYATRSGSKIIAVNGGNPITGSQRYEIDIATELGSEYLNRNLEVRAEILVGGKWGAVPVKLASTTAAGEAYGVTATEVGSSIVVQSAVSGLALLGSLSGHPFGEINTVTSAPCRVVVNKVGDEIGTPVYKGGVGKTVLYEGAVIGNGGDVVLSDSITNFDDIRIYSAFTAANTRYILPTATHDPDTLLKTSGIGDVMCAERYDNSTANAKTFIHPANSIATSLRVTAITGSDWSNVGIYKVVGIRYQ